MCASGRYTHWQLLIDAHRQRSFTHSVRVYTCTELTAMLRAVGLPLMRCTADFAENPSPGMRRACCSSHKKIFELSGNGWKYQVTFAELCYCCIEYIPRLPFDNGDFTK